MQKYIFFTKQTSMLVKKIKTDEVYTPHIPPKKPFFLPPQKNKYAFFSHLHRFFVSLQK